MFGRYPWDGTVLYFGKQVSAQKLPWHYLYGYWLVQLPLYYHLFLLTIVASLVALPRATLRAFADLYRRDYDAFSVVIVLLAALIFPLAVVLLKRPVLYDGLRHLLFVVPLLCLLLYLGFVGVMASMGRLTRAALVVLGALCWFEAVVAMHWLHPYEYAYYNPLVNPAGAFELDYWATSFRRWRSASTTMPGSTASPAKSCAFACATDLRARLRPISMPTGSRSSRQRMRSS